LLAQAGILQWLDLGEREVDTRLDGTLTEQPGTERMDGADETLVDIGEGRLESPALGAFGPLGVVLEPCLEARTELGGGLSRERDCGKGGNARALAGAQEGHHPVNHTRGLARARCGFDQDVRIEIVLDPVPLVLIGRDPPRLAS
jgi:hypothetical protein